MLHKKIMGNARKEVAMPVPKFKSGDLVKPIDSVNNGTWTAYIQYVHSYADGDFMYVISKNDDNETAWSQMFDFESCLQLAR